MSTAETEHCVLSWRRNNPPTGTFTDCDGNPAYAILWCCGTHGVRWSRASMVVNSSHHINPLRATHIPQLRLVAFVASCRTQWTACAAPLGVLLCATGNVGFSGGPTPRALARKSMTRIRKID